MANTLVNVKFIENSRGGQTLVLNRFMYSLKTRKNESSYWRCVDRVCNAKINTRNDIPTKVSGEHNHPRDDSAIVAADIMSGVRKQVRVTPVPSIFNDMLADTLPTFYESKSSLYRDNYEVKKLVVRASALPLVPLASVEDVWFEALGDCDDDSAQVLRFEDYVTEQRVEGDRQAWSHFNNDGPRATNHVEGWHHKINDHLKHCHPHIYTLLDIIKKEQTANEAKIFQHANDGKQRPRKLVYRQLEERLAQLSMGEMDTVSYVDVVSHLVKLH